MVNLRTKLISFLRERTKLISYKLNAFVIFMDLKIKIIDILRRKKYFLLFQCLESTSIFLNLNTT